MQKIMFNDRYGLTDAVLNGRKTMTRRIIPADIAEKLIIQGDEFFPTIPCVGLKSRFKIGEVVAVAQRYKDALNPLDWVNKLIYQDEKSWSNKMFVKSELMPHKIRITNIRIERLQDISAEDCIKEGIIRRDDLINSRMESIVRYTFDRSFEKNIWKTYATPQEAFAALIDKVSGKGSWDSNPFVFVYEFELFK